MPENQSGGWDKANTVVLTQIKTTLAIMGATISLVIIIIPILLTNLYDKLDTINANTVQIATVQTQITAMQRDINRIMNWVDGNRGGRIPTSREVAIDVCDSGCEATLYAYTLESGVMRR